MGARRNRSVSSPPNRAGTVAAVVVAILLAGVTPAHGESEDGYRIEAPSQSELIVGVQYRSGRHAPGRTTHPYASCTFEEHEQAELAQYLEDNQRWGGEFVGVGAYDPGRFETSPTWWSGVCPLDSRSRFASGRRVTVWIPGEVVPVDIAALVEHAVSNISIGAAQVRTAPSGNADHPFLTNLPVGFTLIPAPEASVSGTATAGPLSITATGTLDAVSVVSEGDRTLCDPPLPPLEDLVEVFEPACSLTFGDRGPVSVTVRIVYLLGYRCSTPCDLSGAPPTLTATATVDGLVAQASGLRD